MSESTHHPSAGVRHLASHLSIGEVLGLLLEEFPDVTISKIRFLESQGLIEPERTPSGYRRFYDGDVDLLRLILREQRENFLPLRVIKDRIDSGEINAAERSAPERRGVRKVSTTSVPGDPLLPGLDGPADDAGGPAAPDPSPPAAKTHEVPIAGPPDTGPPDARPPDAEPAATATRTPAGDEPDDDRHDVPGDAVHDAVVDDDAAADLSDTVEAKMPERKKTQKTKDTKVEVDAADNDIDDEDIDRSLVNAAELAAEIDTTPAHVEELRSYGLITSAEHLGEPMFDEDAVAVARICARFMDIGIDARHLRGWRTSADRELSLYEGLTLPLLRQRNPQGRRAARERLIELSELGTALRTVLIEQSLRQHIDR